MSLTKKTARLVAEISRRLPKLDLFPNLIAVTKTVLRKPLLEEDRVWFGVFPSW